MPDYTEQVALAAAGAAAWPGRSAVPAAAATGPAAAAGSEPVPAELQEQESGTDSKL